MEDQDLDLSKELAKRSRRSEEVGLVSQFKGMEIQGNQSTKPSSFADLVGELKYTDPGPAPVPPNVSIPETATAAYLLKFWSKYPKIINDYNVEAAHYRKRVNAARQEMQNDYEVLKGRHGCNFDMNFVSETCEMTMWEHIDFSRTNFETEKLVLKKQNSPEIEKPFFDMSGPLGQLTLFGHGENADESICITNNGSYKLKDIEVRISFFDFLERSKKLKSLISSGYRLKFSLEHMDEFVHFKCVAEPELDKLKVDIIFEDEEEQEKTQSIVFLFPGLATSEKVNAYAVLGVDNVAEYLVDIPIPSIVVEEVDNSKNQLVGK